MTFLEYDTQEGATIPRQKSGELHIDSSNYATKQYHPNTVSNTVVCLFPDSLEEEPQAIPPTPQQEKIINSRNPKVY